jgi:hypothetical protein
LSYFHSSFALIKGYTVIHAGDGITGTQAVNYIPGWLTWLNPAQPRPK